MNKLLVASMAGAFLSVATAQTVTPSPRDKAKQSDVQSATGLNGENSGNTQATAAEQARNVQASKQVTKLSKEEKKKLAKDATKSNVNPENSSGSAATAAMQKETVAQSKAAPKQNPGLKSKQGKQQLDGELQQKSTP